jgi:hypothetical protein
MSHPLAGMNCLCQIFHKKALLPLNDSFQVTITQGTRKKTWRNKKSQNKTKRGRERERKRKKEDEN